MLRSHVQVRLAIAVVPFFHCPPDAHFAPFTPARRRPTQQTWIDIMDKFNVHLLHCQIPGNTIKILVLVRFPISHSYSSTSKVFHIPFLFRSSPPARPPSLQIHNVADSNFATSDEFAASSEAQEWRSALATVFFNIKFYFYQVCWC